MRDQRGTGAAALPRRKRRGRAARRGLRQAVSRGDRRRGERRTHLRPGEQVPDQMYFSIRQPGAGFSATQMRLVARVQGDPTAITPQVRACSASSILMCRWRRWSRWRKSSPARSATSGSAPGCWRASPAAAFLLAVIGLRRARVLGHAAVARARDPDCARRAIGRGVPARGREGMLLVASASRWASPARSPPRGFVSGMLFDVAGTDPNVFVAVSWPSSARGSRPACCPLGGRRGWTRSRRCGASRAELHWDSRYGFCGYRYVPVHVTHW